MEKAEPLELLENWENLISPKSSSTPPVVLITRAYASPSPNAPNQTPDQ
eukprot:CAMPEP_0113955272 /NCGR_PEP_ID=MMETSP0011_2-20120614/1198_1 /TAXON_ID=101924 /ORGANISM="Rhodosorus marinus" /LENGTH=48 /DNA_ID=CAMNT_0000964857 /DNA_START=622 /DNA_END=768 /DNA_ORIENTATION=- /assembly_acc=CAM_ASM_000156